MNSQDKNTRNNLVIFAAAIIFSGKDCALYSDWL